jgi:hypothetical protein
MSKKKTIMMVVALFATASILYASFFSPTVTCDPDSRGTLSQIQQACAEELQANKELYNEVTKSTNKRNNEIREMMGWSDEDFVSM